VDPKAIMDAAALASAVWKVVGDVKAKAAAAKADGKVTAAEAIAIVEAELKTLAPFILALVQDVVA
jgi:hypothetical protein